MPPKSKEENETLTSDGIYELDSWVPVPSDGLQGAGTVDSLDPTFDVSYGGQQLSFDFDDNLRKKYPALQDAWEHYQNVKQMCETREKEEDDS